MAEYGNPKWKFVPVNNGFAACIICSSDRIFIRSSVRRSPKFAAPDSLDGKRHRGPRTLFSKDTDRTYVQRIVVCSGACCWDLEPECSAISGRQWPASQIKSSARDCADLLLYFGPLFKRCRHGRQPLSSTKKYRAR